MRADPRFANPQRGSSGYRAAPLSIADLKPYPEYKESDRPWLGALPRCWRYLRAKYLFREVDERSQSGSEELLSVSHLTGVTPRSQKKVTMFMAESNIGYKISQPNDIVINTMWAWMGALGVTRDLGIVSPSYGVYRPLGRSELLPSYADYLLRSPLYVAEYTRRSTGVNSSRMRLYPERFLEVDIVVPPTDEQAAIVRFLDYVSRGFELVILAKKRQLALVGELRQSVTEHTLSSTGNTSVRLSVAAELMRRLVCREWQQVYTPLGLYNRGRGVFHKTPTSGADLGDSEFFWVQENDLILSGQFAWEGAVALAAKVDSGCVVSHRYPVLRGRPEFLSSAALFAFFRTQFGAFLLDQHSRGAAGRNRPLNISSVLKEKMPVPPRSAQERLEELVLLEATIADSIKRMSRAMREYRTRLIEDVVTGKLDVRGVEVPEGEEVEKAESLEAENSEDLEQEEEAMAAARKDDDAAD